MRKCYTKHQNKRIIIIKIGKEHEHNLAFYNKKDGS
jgi:hypothetical protein